MHRIGARLTLLLVVFAAVPAIAQQDTPYEVIGTIAPRHARDITASNWSVGAETMDRDYTVYANWKDYLGPLGIKKARIQGGWAKTEPRAGEYDFAWLDAIVFDMREQGVDPWMCLSYGNPLYVTGGGTLLGAALPQAPESLAAWLRWVAATVTRYKDVIGEWEVWNEPNNKGVNSAEAYTSFLIETARAIRSVQPEARILAMATAGVDTQFIRLSLELLSDANALGLVDDITYHPYKPNPDDSYPAVEELRQTVAAFSPRIAIRQGENGCPSALRKTKALNGLPWTETKQAKWALRRMLGDLGRGIPSSYFSIIDMKYPDEMNMKGLLAANGNKTVAYAKPAYYAVQRLAAVFTDRFDRIPGFAFQHTAKESLSLFAFRDTETGATLITAWYDGETPSDSSTKTPVNFTFPKAAFTMPVWVDLREGTVFRIPNQAMEHEAGIWRFSGIPCYDSPVLIADLDSLSIVKRKDTP